MFEKVVNAFNLVGVTVKSYLSVIIVVIGLLVAWQGWGAVQKYINNQTAARVEENKKLVAQLELMNQEIGALKADKGLLATKNGELAQDVAKWKAEAGRNPLPKPVGNPPQDVAQAITEIAVSGVRFALTVPKLGDDPITTGFISTEARNTPVIWTWYKESLRVPGLETAYKSQVGLTTSLSGQVVGLQEEVKQDNLIIKKQDDSIKLSSARAANLEVIVKDTTKQVNREKFNGNVKAVAAVVLGFFVGRGVTK